MENEIKTGAENMKRKRLFGVPTIAIGFLAWLLFIIFYLNTMPVRLLQESLIAGTFYFLEATFGLVVLGLIYARKTIWQGLTAVSLRSWVFMALIAVLGLVLTVGVAPKTNRIYYDEDIYQDQAHNLASLHRAQICNEGEMEFGRLQCKRFEYNKWPSGYPYLLSLAYRAFGVEEKWSFLLNNIAIVLGALFVFGIGILLFQSEIAGLIAALAYVTIPQNALWFNTASVEPTSAVSAAAAVLAWLAYARSGSSKLLLIAATITPLAMQFRMESILIAPVVAAIVLLFRPKALFDREFWRFLLLAAVLLIPLVGHLLAVKDEPWGATQQARFSLEHFSHNLPINLSYYFRNTEFPIVVSILAILGAAGLGRWRERLIASIWFLLFWGIFAFFYAGSYQYGADIRYSAVSYASLAILAGGGSDQLVQWFSRWRTRKWIASVVSIGVLINLFIFFMPLIRAVGEEAWESRADHEYASEIASTLPPHSIILTHNPNMFLLWGKNAAQMSIAANEKEYVLQHYLKRYTGGVYIYWNFWCNVNDPVQVDFCTRVIENYSTEKVMSRKVWRANFILYKIEGDRQDKGTTKKIENQYMYLLEIIIEVINRMYKVPFGSI